MLTLRKIEPEDREFLHRVYASTRAEELALTGWDEAQKETFLKMQFEAQDRFYHEHYEQASFQIIVRDGAAAGRIYVNRGAGVIELIDIALLPEHRRAGLGTARVKELLEEAERTRKPVLIYVEQFNPAQRLYQRLGFVKVEEVGVYWKMRWTPEGMRTK